VTTGIDRRRLLAGLAATPVTVPAGLCGELSLAAAARLSGRLYGAAVRASAIATDSDYRGAVARECAIVTPELELKWAAVEPERGSLRFAPADTIVDFAQAARLEVHGHTLVWHRSIPDWAYDRLVAQRDWNDVARYMGAALTRYGDAIPVWDVVNEPIDPNGPAGMRPTRFLQAFGPSYVAQALHTARSFAPNGLLMINDYGMEGADPESEDRRTAFLKLLDRLAAAGAPLDGVGLQAHLDLRGPPISTRRLARFLHELAGRNLKICITELDVKEADYALDAERRDLAVAAAVRPLLDAALATPHVGSVATWGLSDRYSWLEVTPADLRRHPTAWRDGSSPGLNRGLPLDAALRPKAMREALLQGFLSARSKSDATTII
jgi:endo-1,4-beta-xylanase